MFKLWKNPCGPFPFCISVKKWDVKKWDVCRISAVAGCPTCLQNIVLFTCAASLGILAQPMLPVLPPHPDPSGILQTRKVPPSPIVAGICPARLFSLGPSGKEPSRASGAFVLTSPICHRGKLSGVSRGVCLQSSAEQTRPSAKNSEFPAQRCWASGPRLPAQQERVQWALPTLGCAHRIASFSAVSSLSSDNVF